MSSRQTFVGWVAVAAASGLVCVSLSVGQEPGANARNRAAKAAKAPADTGDEAAARAPATLLPADPVIYVGWDGEAAHREAWEGTAAYQAIYETGLAEVAQKMFAGFVPQQSGEQTALFGEVSESIRENGLSLAVTVPPADGLALPWAVAVLHGSAGLEPRIAEAVRAAVPPESGVEISTEDRAGRAVTTVRVPQIPVGDLGWWVEGDHLVVAAGVGGVNHALAVAEAKAGDLTDSRLWRAYQDDEESFETVSVAWLDAAKLFKTVGPIPLPINGPDQPPVTIDRVVRAAGLDALQAFVVRSGYDGAATVTDVRVETTESRQGLLGLGYQEPISLADLPPLPAKLNGFGVRSLDLARLYDAVLGTVREVSKLGPPEAGRQIDQALGQAREAIGLDLKAELLEPLGHVLCCYNDGAQGPAPLALTVAISVDDAEKVRAGLDKLLERIGRQVPPSQFNARRIEKHGREVVTLEIAGAVANPSFVVTDEWLVLSVVPQAVETFLLRTDEELPAWEADGDLAEALEGVPEEFTGLTVSDPRETYRLIGGLAPVVLPIVRRVVAESQGDAAKERLLDIAVADLPPAELISAPLFPNVSVTYVEGNTVVKHSRSSLPGLPFGDSGSVGPGTAAVGIALLLPAVQQAREAARRAQSNNNLKQIGLAMHNYHDIYSYFPAGTVKESAKEPEDRLSWMIEILPFIEQTALFQQFDRKQAWDSEANREWSSMTIPNFNNPSDPDSRSEKGPLTNYVGLAGVGEDGPTLPVTDKKAGMFAYGRSTRMADIKDGTSNTAMVSEAIGKTTGPWAQGGKGTIRPITQKPYVNGPDGLGGYHTGGCSMVMADGAVRFISEKIDPSVVEAIVTINGGEFLADDALGER